MINWASLSGKDWIFIGAVTLWMCGVLVALYDIKAELKNISAWLARISGNIGPRLGR